MLAQKRHKIMYKNIFSNFFIISNWTLDPPAHFQSLFGFFIFFYLHGPFSLSVLRWLAADTILPTLNRRRQLRRYYTRMGMSLLRPSSMSFQDGRRSGLARSSANLLDNFRWSQQGRRSGYESGGTAYMSTQREVLEGQTGSHRAKRANFGRGVRGSSPGKFQKPTWQMVQSTLFLSYIC